MQRYLSVDILRGIAILLMIQVHFVDNLSSSEASSAWLYDASSLLGMLPAPLFTLLSGLSFSLWTRKQQANGVRDDAITKVAVRRGLFLFGAGIALNFFVWLPEETFNWDILTLIGAALFILAYARKLPSEVIGLVCVLVLLITPPLRGMSEYAEYWQDGAYVPEMEFRDVALGFFLNGYFPLLPWIIFPLIGFIIGDTAFRQPGSGTFWLAAIGVGLMSLTALALACKSVLPAAIAKHYAEGFTLYPASTEYTLGTLGFSLLSLALLHHFIDRNDHDNIVYRFLQRWSHFSLSVYILHHVVHIWPLWWYGMWMEKDDVTFYWRDAMSTPTAFSLAVAFVVLGGFGLVWLERHKHYSFESMMRWLCDTDA